MHRARLRSLITGLITMMAVLMGSSAAASAVEMPHATVASATAVQGFTATPAADVQSSAVTTVTNVQTASFESAATATSSKLSKFWAAPKYPYPGASGGNSPAGYDMGQCFDYGIWAWHYGTGTKFDHVKVANFKSVAKARGYKVSTKPKKGALAIWKTSNRNHAAYVREYKSGASTFVVREVRWNTVGPSNRTIKVSDINKYERAPNFFIYAK